MSQTPTIGRVVLYTLTVDDALTGKVRTVPGQQQNDPHVGEEYPATVVRVFGEPQPGSPVNLRVQLDGNGPELWATSRTEGEGPGHWRWPPRV